MSIVQQGLLGSGISLSFILGLLCSAAPSVAQVLIGGEFGMAEHYQRGTFTSFDGTSFGSASGSSDFGSLFAEYVFNDRSALGIKISSGNQEISGDATRYSTIEPDVADPYLSDTLTRAPYASIGTTLWQFGAYYQYRPFQSPLFVQAGPKFSYVSSSSTSESLHYISGATESITSLLKGLNSWQVSVEASLGYDLWQADRISLTPMVSYEFGLTPIVSNSDLRISSLFGSLCLKYRL